MRFSKPSTRVLAISAVVAALTACIAAQMTPTWEKWFSVNEQENRFETVQNTIYDPAGAVVSVGYSSNMDTQQDSLVVLKQATNGTLLWKTAVDLGDYDHSWDSVIGSDGSIYTATESTLAKFSSNGTLLWQRNISTLINGDAAIRDIEFSNNQIYVAGRDLYVFDVNGNLSKAVAQIAPLWTVKAHSTGIYTAGTGTVTRYNSSLSKVWSYTHSDAQNPPADLAIANDGTVYAATYNDEPQDSSYLTRISNTGTQVWTKFFNDPDTNSFSMPGMPKVRILPNGNLVLGLSQQPTRIINIIDPANGNVKSSTTQKTGLITRLEVDSKGGIYVTGSNTPQKFDSTGTLLANGKIGGSTEVTSGGLAFTADSIYVSAGAFNNGEMRMYVSRYANQ